VAEHISRKELKQDKIRESIEHGAEAVYSHSRAVGLILVVALLGVAGYAGWNFYSGRQNLEASAALDAAMKVYNAPLRAANIPVDASEPSYANEQARAEDAAQKFQAVADKYPRTNPGKLARYYEVLCLEDLNRFNQALEELKKLQTGNDKELAAMAQYQMANIYARTNKTDEAIRAYRAAADAHATLVPRPVALLELADLLRQSKPAEAASIYEQIKKDYPNTSAADRAERGLSLMAPKT
jgi:predicted negative regulator of RcsB-dependent stress response